MLLALLLALEPAHAAKLSRCTATLDLPVGRVDVPGFGATELQAAEHARRAAAALAGWYGPAELLGGLLADPAAALGRHVGHLEALDVALAAPSPGMPIQAGACTTVTLPANKEGAAWSAVWADASTPVIRADAGLAVEAARRRTCFGSFQKTAHALLSKAEAGLGPDAWRVAVSGLADARDALARCVTEVSPEVTAAIAPVPAVEVTGVFSCGRPRRGPSGWTAAAGYGADLESAREAALARDLLVVARQVTADALAGSLARDPGAAVRAALDPVRTLVVGADVVEQATLICAVAVPVQVRYQWTPAPGCGEPEPAIPFVASASALEALAGGRCDGMSAAGTAATVKALAARGTEGALAASGFGAALGCAASCGRDGLVTGWEPRPVRLPSELDRSTAEAAQGELSRAVARRDLDAFAILTGGLMLHPRYASAARSDPDAFWGSLEEAGRTGRLADAATWERVSGQWVLSFK